MFLCISVLIFLQNQESSYINKQSEFVKISFIVNKNSTEITFKGELLQFTCFVLWIRRMMIKSF